MESTSIDYILTYPPCSFTISSQNVFCQIERLFD